jgi:hypothetical protein
VTAGPATADALTSRRARRLGLLPTDSAAAFELKTKEINNGRLAMIAVAGFAVQEEVDHVTIWRGLVEEKVSRTRPRERAAARADRLLLLLLARSSRPARPTCCPSRLSPLGFPARDCRRCNKENT